MKQKTVIASALISATLLFAQTATAQNMVWKEQTIQLKQTPQKLAVYELSALDTLNALGIQAQVIPDTSFPNQLNVYNGNIATKAGTLFEPDVTVLSAQKPDLIVLGGRSQAKADTLQGIAPVLNLSPDTDNLMPDLKARTELFADLFGKQAQAAKRLQIIDTKQAKLKAQTKGKTALMLFTNKGNFMPHAEGERFGYVYEFSGLKSVLPVVPPKDPNAPATPRPEAGSPEALAAKAKADARLQAAVAAQPDYVIVLDRGAVNTNEYTALEEWKKNPILNQSKAKIILVDANAWYLVGPGLSNTEFMLDELIKGTQH
ncbi:putative iron ABC transporter substrate-binding protein [Vitreoscilla sp. C1]|uniref:ABC transporter substrate-binding protein n=1 Tax=Vitreoscilla sp. (strain C1) TaxID=96942 RepID=UPI000CDC87B6|nr:ABC transporter substrate-binding protein [Vitreoscilla sp. C1]AUZ06147.1 putative iron ABC transporter substrate-binding protein [Vitreoscilla sp. C1]